MKPNQRSKTDKGEACRGTAASWGHRQRLPPYPVLIFLSSSDPQLRVSLTCEHCSLFSSLLPVGTWTPELGCATRRHGEGFLTLRPPPVRFQICCGRARVLLLPGALVCHMCPVRAQYWGHSATWTSCQKGSSHSTWKRSDPGRSCPSAAPHT